LAQSGEGRTWYRQHGTLVSTILPKVKRAGVSLALRSGRSAPSRAQPVWQWVVFATAADWTTISDPAARPARGLVSVTSQPSRSRKLGWCRPRRVYPKDRWGLITCIQGEILSVAPHVKPALSQRAESCHDRSQRNLLLWGSQTSFAGSSKPCCLQSHATAVCHVAAILILVGFFMIVKTPLERPRNHRPKRE
jgi:hypothetical protein